MSGVRTYNPSVRVGNWNEDIVLEEDHIKEFIEKRENNELFIQRASNLQKKLLYPVELSKSPDGCLRIGDVVCLLHIPTHSVIAGHMSAYLAQEEIQLLPDSKVTSCPFTIACPRNAFVIGSYDSTAKAGDVVLYEELITFTTLKGPGGQLSLESDRATLMEHSKYTRGQVLKLTKDTSYKTAWRILCFNQEDRLELFGTPAPANRPIFINHSKTNNHLAVHADWKPRTSFGYEYEASGCSKFTIHKAEDVHNHFMVVTGDYLAELESKKGESKK